MIASNGLGQAVARSVAALKVLVFGGFTEPAMTVIVLLPLAALVLSAASIHWSEFVHVVLSPRALGS